MSQAADIAARRAERATAALAEAVALGSVGDVLGPSSANDNRFARFDGATGKAIQNSLAVLDDTGNASGFVSVAVGATPAGAGEIRLPNAHKVLGKSSGGADVGLLSYDGSDLMQVGFLQGGGARPANLLFDPSGGYFFRAAGTPAAFFSASTHYLAFPTAVGAAAAPAASAALDVVSTTKGLLPPRMTTTERDAIASPASGLVIYNTTLGKLNVRGASAWEEVTSV